MTSEIWDLNTSENVIPYPRSYILDLISNINLSLLIGFNEFAGSKFLTRAEYFIETVPQVQQVSELMLPAIYF